MWNSSYPTDLSASTSNNSSIIPYNKDESQYESINSTASIYYHNNNKINSEINHLPDNDYDLSTALVSNSNEQTNRSIDLNLSDREIDSKNRLFNNNYSYHHHNHHHFLHQSHLHHVHQQNQSNYTIDYNQLLVDNSVSLNGELLYQGDSCSSSVNNDDSDQISNTENNLHQMYNVNNFNLMDNTNSQTNDLCKFNNSNQFFNLQHHQQQNSSRTLQYSNSWNSDYLNSNSCNLLTSNSNHYNHSYNYDTFPNGYGDDRTDEEFNKNSSFQNYSSMMEHKYYSNRINEKLSYNNVKEITFQSPESLSSSIHRGLISKLNNDDTNDNNSISTTHPSSISNSIHLSASSSIHQSYIENNMISNENFTENNNKQCKQFSGIL